MYSMPYYTYGNTTNFLFLEPTALIYIIISKERRCNEDQRGVGNFKIERVDSYGDVSEGQLNANGV